MGTLKVLAGADEVLWPMAGFTLIAPLHKGRNNVYRGVRRVDGLPVVLKLSENLVALKAELSLLESTDSDHVVRPIGIGETDEGLALVLQDDRMISVADLCGGRGRPLREALQIAVGAARGLADLHAARILHRDVKPSSLLFDPERGLVKLLDFSVAARLPAGGNRLPARELVGTLAYLPPEQSGRTTLEVDHRADLYGLGVCMFELLSGTLPYTALDPMELVSQHIAAPVPRVRNGSPRVPVVVSDLIGRLMSKTPVDRYQTALGLLADLERCLASLAEANDHTIDPFSLGQHDPPPLRSPERCIGRDTEVAALEAALERARGGTVQVVTVEGREGSGRSILVGSVVADRSDVLVGRGDFVGNPTEPLHGIRTALEDIAQRILTYDDVRLTVLRDRLISRLGSAGGVLVELAPGFEQVMGSQPPLEPLGPAATQGRIQFVLQQAFEVFGHDALCVLWFDGADHLDAANLMALQTLVAADGLRLAVIGSCTEPSEGLTKLATTQLSLGDLHPDAVVATVATALGVDDEQVSALGELIAHRTRGHAASIPAFLHKLLELGVMTWRMGWHYDLDEVARADLPASAAGLVAQGFSALHDTTRSVVLAAVLAPQPVDPRTIADWIAISIDRATEGLIAATHRGFLRRSSDGFRAAQSRICEIVIHEADPADVRFVRGAIGRSMLNTASDETLRSHAFTVLEHVSQGQPELESSACRRAAELSRFAARAAIATMASADACRLAELGLGFATRADRKLVETEFALHMLRGQALSLLGEAETADDVFAALCERELSPAEIEEVYSTRVEAMSGAGRFDAAIDIAITGLSRLGVRLPRAPSLLRVLPRVWLNQRRIDRLGDRVLELPKCTNDRAQAVIRLCSAMAAASYVVSPLLLLLVNEVGIATILEHGLTPPAAIMFGSHGMFLAVAFKQFDKAYVLVCRCRQLAQRTSGQFRAIAAMGGFVTAPYYEPTEPLRRGMREASRVLLEHGEPIHAGYLFALELYLRAYEGTPLPATCDRLKENQLIFARLNQTTVVDTAEKIGGLLSSFVDDEDGVAVLDRIHAVESGASSHSADYYNRFVVTFPMFADGHYDELERWYAEMATDFYKVCLGAPFGRDVELIWGLLAARRGDRRGVKKQLDAVRRMQRRIKGAFARHRALLEAELFRVDGRIGAASDAYSRAAAHAEADNALHLLALAHERRADMLAAAKRETEARLFYREAVDAYRRWGHMRKVKRMEAIHPYTRTIGRIGNTTSPTPHGMPSTLDGERLDLGTILKVGQQISQQLDPAGVVRAVLRGVAENTGAERAVLVLSKAGSLCVVAQFCGGTTTAHAEPLEGFMAVPHGLVRSVYRTGAAQVIADAQHERSSRHDPHVRASGVRALAVVPIASGGQRMGVVVLENASLVGAFTEPRVRVVQALATQAAISLENATLYKDLESRVEQRTAQLRNRNEAMRLVLDNVVQALVVVDREGRLSAERSAVLEQWFGVVPSTLVELVAALDPRGSERFEACWDLLKDGALPIELCVAQLPKRLEHLRGDTKSTYALEYQLIPKASSSLDRMLVVMTDISEKLAQERLEARQTELASLFERWSQAPQSLIEYRRETKRIIAELERRDGDTVEKRGVHTLKGNSAILSLHRLAKVCQEIETAASSDDHRPFRDEEIALVLNVWNDIDELLERLLAADESRVRVDLDELRDVLGILESEAHPLAQSVRCWTAEPLHTRLSTLAADATALAARLGKDVEVTFDGGGVLLRPGLWSGFWSTFVHVLRNAIDHGIEPAAERGDKPERGHLRLTGRHDGHRFTIVVTDDGRGIDWNRLRARAEKMGLPGATRDELVLALFHDGISTREVVTEVSGRGLGLAAVLQATQSLGGCVDVIDNPGGGTTFMFIFPPACVFRSTSERTEARAA